MNWQHSQRTRQDVTQQAIALLVDLHEIPVTLIVRLACCSSSCRSLLQAWCKQMVRSLLPRAVRETAALYRRSPRKAILVMKWFVATVGREACEDSTLTEAVTNIPAVPLAIAKCVMDGGLRITYKQLIEAAKRRVAGVEVWVTARNQDFDPLVRACCCNTLELVEAAHLPAFIKLGPRQFMDLLSITFNNLDPAAAEHIMQRLKRPASEAAWQMTRALQQSLQNRLDRLKGFFFARQFVQLLHTAAVRGHMSLMEQLCSYKVAGVKIKPDKQVQILQAVLSKPYRLGIMQTVGRLDYFTSLPSNALHSFIKSTVSALADFKFIPAESSEDPNYNKWQTLRLDLYGLVALWQAAPRPEAALLDVIKTAVQHSSTAALQELESVIKVLPADSMQDLLTYTLHERIAQCLAGCRSARRCLKILVRSEAAASVSDHTIAQLLLQAMQSRDGEFVQVLCDGLHQVYDVVGTVGEEVLLQAVLQRDSKTVRAINDANNVVGCPVGLAFAAAVRTGQHSVLMDLDDKVCCRRSDIDRAFVLAVQSHKQRVFSEFLESYQLDPEKDRCLHELFLLALSAAVQFDNLKALERLCNLSYDYNLGAEFISNFDAIVHLAIVLGKQRALDILCRTVWGGQISNDSKACVFDAARNKGFDRVGPIRIMCLGQRHFPSMGLLGRLENAKRSWRALGLRAYDLEKGLSDLDPFFLSSMLQVLAASTPAAAAATAKSAGQHPTAKPDVLSLPGIQQLKPESVSRLLLAAVQLRAVTVVQQLCTLPAAADICVEDAAYLLEQAIDLHYSQCPSYSCRDLQGRVMHCISKLPCVQSLQHSWLVGSIHAAVQHNGDVAVDLITQLSAAQDFSNKTVLQLLHTALVQGTAHIFSRLCSLPGARGLTLSNLVTLLRAGMADYHRAAHVKPLTDLLHSLPLAKQYWRSKDTIESLLDTAAHELDDRQQVMEVMRCLLNVPDLAHLPLDKQRFKMIRALNVESFLELHELKTVHCSVQKVVD